MWYQFFLENINFAIGIFTSITFFMVFWLYYDGWNESKKSFDLLKAIGFFLLALAFISDCVTLQSSFSNSFYINRDFFAGFYLILKIVGYLFLILGIVTDPIQEKPKIVDSLLVIPVFIALEFVAPLLAGVVAFFYYKKASIGLEKHLGRICLAFLLFSFSELFRSLQVFTNTPAILMYQLASPFGLFWVISTLLQFFASLILLKWSFGYLFKRFFTQIYVVFNLTIVALFLIITVTFTFVLTKNIVDETLLRLSIDSKVIMYAINAKKSEQLSDAIMISQADLTVNSVTNGKRDGLQTYLESVLVNKGLDSIIVVDDNYKVLVRAEDRERYSDSLSSDEEIKRILSGEKISTIQVAKSSVSPQMTVKVGSPIKGGKNKIIGAVVIKNNIDNIFLDGIKKETGLEASIYANDILSATSINKNSNRPNGVKEENQKVIKNVLKESSEYKGEVRVFGNSYFASYLPIVDMDSNVSGMLFVGRDQSGVLENTSKSIELTFISAVLLLFLSLLPSYWVSRYIEYQLS